MTEDYSRFLSHPANWFTPNGGNQNAGWSREYSRLVLQAVQLVVPSTEGAAGCIRYLPSVEFVCLRQCCDPPRFLCGAAAISGTHQCAVVESVRRIAAAHGRLSGIRAGLLWLQNQQPQHFTPTSANCECKSIHWGEQNQCDVQNLKRFVDSLSCPPFYLFPFLPSPSISIHPHHAFILFKTNVSFYLLIKWASWCGSSQEHMTPGIVWINTSDFSVCTVIVRSPVGNSQKDL